MNYSLDSLKVGDIGDHIGDYYRGFKAGYEEFRRGFILCVCKALL